MCQCTYLSTYELQPAQPGHGELVVVDVGWHLSVEQPEGEGDHTSCRGEGGGGMWG